MSQVFTIIVIFSILVFFFFIVYNQDSCKTNPIKRLKRSFSGVPRFKNCITESDENGINITVQRKNIGENCPNGAITCPQYFGCDNDNIPFCRNINAEGDYESPSCPTCENGKWKCDFFVMGNSGNGIPTQPIESTVNSDCDNDSLYNSGSEKISCEYKYCSSLDEDCEWGSFNTGGRMVYADKGVESKDKVTGYKVGSSGEDTLFKLSFGYDASAHLGNSGIVTINNQSLRDCIKEAKKDYDFTAYNSEKGADQTYTYDGSFGFVYDQTKRICNLYRMQADDLGTGTAKLVKG